MENKSTFDINRETAIAMILRNINNFTNRQLENILEGSEESMFRNYIVYDDIDDIDWDRPIINISEF